MLFPNALMYESGGAEIDTQIDCMREAILNKDGIVQDEN